MSGLSPPDPLTRKGHAASVRRQSRQRLRSRWAPAGSHFSLLRIQHDVEVLRGVQHPAIQQQKYMAAGVLFPQRIVGQSLDPGQLRGGGVRQHSLAHIPLKLDVSGLSSDKKVGAALYNDDDTTSENIGYAMRDTGSTASVITSVANLYLRKQIIFEKV